MLSVDQQATVKAWLADATAKVAAWPKRIEEEAALSAKEGRQPYHILPLTQVSPAIMGPLLESVSTGKVPDDLAETYGTVRRVCTQHPDYEFAMRCDQLIALLKLAKLDA